jgi:hypothetical protein
MTPTIKQLLTLVVTALSLVGVVPIQAAGPLPSWNDGKAKQAIADFVARVTNEGSPDFVPVAERIATFDNDGTLWCEKPTKQTRPIRIWPSAPIWSGCGKRRASTAERRNWTANCG